MAANEEKSAIQKAGFPALRPSGFWSTAILAAFVMLIAVLLFHVVRPFLFPLFFSAILAVLFRPAHVWLTQKLHGCRRIAAAATTVGVVLCVMLPLAGALLLAGVELFQAGRDLLTTNVLVPPQDEVAPTQNAIVIEFKSLLSGYLSEQQISQLGRGVSKAVEGMTTAVYERTQSLVADAVLFVFGILVMIMGLYYLLADGDNAGSEISNLLPLDRDDQRVLFARFESVCRGVVIGTVVAGVVQGVLAGFGFALVGVEKIWMLALLTMFFSFTPVVGAAMIWLTVVVSLLVNERYLPALFLTLYGTFVISLADNFIKAYVIGDRSQMHPFVVFVTVLGALQFVGLWGIFLGPVTAAFFFALLTSLRRKIGTGAEKGHAVKSGHASETNPATAT